MHGPAEIYLTLRADVAAGTLAQVRELTAPDQVDDLAAQPLPLVLARLEEVHELASTALRLCEVRCNGKRPGDVAEGREGREGRPAGGTGRGRRAETHLHGERPNDGLDRVPGVPAGRDRAAGQTDSGPRAVHDPEQGEVIEMHAPPRVTPDTSDVTWID